MTPFRQKLPRRQRGILTAMAAVILVAAVMFVLAQSLGIIGKTSLSNQSQGDSIAAFFLAESGLERGLGLLRAAPDPTARSVCETDIPGPSSLGGGGFTLTAAAGCSGTPEVCTTCTITSMGTVGAASRSVVRVFSLEGASGGATGCGGHSTSTAGGLCANYTANVYPQITQTINVLTSELPVILMSNMAYLRHPAWGGPVDAGACLTIPSTEGCIFQWNDESSHAAGAPIVGSRGATARISSQTESSADYTLEQKLTAQSLFAAVGAKIGGTGVDKIGSYWGDDGSSDSVANNSSGSGQSTNGARCDTNATVSAFCPAYDNPPAILSSGGSHQRSMSWCSGADTLVLGFSGRSSEVANIGQRGSLSAFTFGSSPASVEVPNGTAKYPNTNWLLYSSLRYIYNKNYLSNADASSGGVVTASAGVSSSAFQATLTTTSTNMSVTSLGAGSTVYVGDKIYCNSNNDGCSNNKLVGTVASVPDGSGGFISTTGASSSSVGAYMLTANSSVSVTDKSLLVSSPFMYVSARSSGWLSVGDQLSGSSTATVTSVPSSCANNTTCQTVNAAYGIDPPAQFASISSNNVQANGYTIHVTAGGTPVEGTVIAVRLPADGSSATGKFANLISTTPSVWSNRACVADSPAPTPALFYVNAYDAATKTCSPSTRQRASQRLENDQICGGICAFFDHSLETTGPAPRPPKSTYFDISIANTQQWAAGMTCLSGVNTASIIGLTGNAPAVTPTQWYEKVN